MAIKKIKLKSMSGDILIPDVGIPSQTGNNGKVLGTNGSSLQFVDMPTVTSTYSATGTDAVNGVAVSNAIATKQDKLVSGTNIKTIGGTSLLGSGNIALPTVNNATLTIQKNGSNVATFTANASSNVTANISVPNTVSSVSSSSTNADAVGAKLFYDTVGDIEAALHAINSGGVAEMVNLTVYLKGKYQSGFSKLTINNNNYSLSDFNNGTKTIQVPKNETLNWSVITLYGYGAFPSSGTLNLTDDSTLIIDIQDVPT